MSIQISITGGGEKVILTEGSVTKCRYMLEDTKQSEHLEASIDSVILEGAADLYGSEGETANVMNLINWVLCGGTDAGCYRQLTVKLFGSTGELMQTIRFDKAFVVDYKERFSSKIGRAGFEITIRKLID